MTEIDKEELSQLQDEIAKLASEFEPIRQSMSLDEKVEMLSRDRIADAGRRQNQLQALIRHANQIIHERKLK